MSPDSPLASLPGAEPALGRILSAWEGTPHRAGQSRCGRDGGVDCVHLVWAVVTEWRSALMWERDPPRSLPRIAQDAGMHSMRAVARSAAVMLRAFPALVIRDPIGSTLMCGDVLMIRVGARPNHAAIVGPGGSDVWHAASGPFGVGGAGAVVRSSLFDARLRSAVRRAYRPIVRRSTR